MEPTSATTDFWTGLLTGVGAAVVGFALSQVAVALRDRAQRRKRDRTVLTSLDEEVRANRQSAENTENLVQTEINNLQTGGPALLNPFDPLETGAWELLVSNLPDSVATNEDLLGKLREYKRLTYQVNEMIRSRERWRHSFHKAISDLQGYDGLIQTFLGELLNAINALEPQLNELRQ
jgi:hypothetical protein